MPPKGFITTVHVTPVTVVMDYRYDQTDVTFCGKKNNNKSIMALKSLLAGLFVLLPFILMGLISSDVFINV